MKKLSQKILSIVLCLIMAVSLCMPAFALDRKTTELYAKQLAVAGIQKVAGMIPTVGESISGAIGNFLPDMLGIESDHSKVMKKLEEIYSAIQGLDFKLNEQQQTVFQLYHQGKIDDFNTAANELRGTIDYLYDRLMEIEDEYEGKSQDEKQVAIATLITSNQFDETAYAIAQLKNLTSYLCGTQISNGMPDGIFQLVYLANCKDSALGGEAALKSAAYVQSFCQYMETAYKTLFAIYASKLYVCENSEKITAEMENGTIPRYNISDYTSYDIKNIKSAVFSSNNSSLLTYYNKLFNENDKNSAISRYNGMLTEIWFSYINGTDYTQSPVKIDYIPLDREIGFLVPYNIGYGENLSKETTNMKGTVDYPDQIRENFKTVDESMLGTAHSVLSADQISRLMGHLANIPALGMDEKNPSITNVLDYLGFDFDAYNSYVERTLGSAAADEMIEVLPMSTKAVTGELVLTKRPPIQFEEKYPETPSGWVSNSVVGYNLDDSVMGADGSFSAQMVKVCHEEAHTGEKRGEVINDPRVMLLYFTEPEEAPLIASLFSSPSPKAIALICIVVAVIAVSTVSIVRKKKKAAKN